MCSRTRSSVLVLLVASLFTGVPAVLAQPVPVGPEFQVNSYTTDYQDEPAVAGDAAGNFVVIWRSNGSAGTDDSANSIQGQRYDSTGAALGGEFQVNTFTPSLQRSPDVAMDGAGNFVVVWASFGTPGDPIDFSVQGQRYDGTGVAQGSQFQVNTYTTGFQGVPRVAMDGAGNFVVVWGQIPSNEMGSIQGQRFDSTGAALGGEFQVNTNTIGPGNPDVARDASGNFVVVWESFGSAGSDTDSASILGQRFDSTGAAQGSEFQVNTYTTGEQSSPTVAAAPAGNFVVVWNSPGNAGSDTNYSVQGQRYDSSGAAQGSEFQVNTYTTGFQGGPDVSADSAGNFLVVWAGVGSSGTDTDFGVFGQRYDSAGAAQGGDFQVNTYTTGDQGFPAVAARGATSFVVAWSGYGSTGSDTLDRSIHAQLFDVPTTTSSTSTTATTSTTSTTVPSAACPPAPDPGCIDVTTPGTRFIVREDTPGTESLELRTGRGAAQMPTALGDPTVSGGTSYGLCVYRDAGALVQQYTVARAGDTCGGHPCWRILGPPRGGPPTNGYRYVDRARLEDGIRVLELRAARHARVSVRGRNGAGSSNLPLGVTAGLAGATSATVQVRGSDASACLSIALTNVRRSTATVFVGTDGGP